MATGLRDWSGGSSAIGSDPVSSMWSQVQAAAPPLASSEAGPEEQQRGCVPLAPSSRSKHAMCISQDGCFYLLAGRSANLPLKDLWRFDPGRLLAHVLAVYTYAQLTTQARVCPLPGVGTARAQKQDSHEVKHLRTVLA
ncbi:hypothetical protein HPB47_024860 [Ixodes persulcatus]|uniref:Uncharacterized protein n=1 Tax=Ixodes persulcatus TaxID=34615 RepID=A0AC60Q5Y1_IXOPE|nr:hypothetical protein HPB47_024860 [Ixodes persulcatus]